MQLFNGSVPLVSSTLDRRAESFSFSGSELTPGSVYGAVLTVESGGLVAASSCEGATGEIRQNANGRSL